MSDIKPLGSIYEPLLNRARFQGIIDDRFTDEDIIQRIGDYKSYRFNAEQLITKFDNVLSVDESTMKNIFGYLFAKSIEANLPNYKHISYHPEDAWNGVLNIEADKMYRPMLEDMYGVGKQFYKDYKFSLESGLINSKNVKGDLLNILVVVQKLGEVYSHYMLKQSD